MSVLFPDGISNIVDLPFHIHDAISQGMSYVSFDELESEERPPKSIWLDQDKLGHWFDAVSKRRKEKYGGGKDDKTIEDPVQNDAVSMLIAGDLER